MAAGAAPGRDRDVLAARRAVRESLRAAMSAGDVAPGAVVLAAVSGGADSLALAAALAWVGPRLGLDAGGVIVDHGLQPGSLERAETAAKQCSGLGLSPVVTVTTSVAATGAGPEAEARNARYDALTAAAAREGASAMLTGHTLDDQAETVLLGLARGSGGRSLSGMAPRSVMNGRLLLRPFLGIRRATTHAACAALGLEPWHDPHNDDPAFTRVRARHEALPALESALGPGVVEALARTADLLRADSDALDGWAGSPGAADLACDRLAALPAAVRRRVLRTAAVAAGAPAGAVSATHVRELERLVVDWHGQSGVSLPGGLVGERRCDRLSFR